jgi:hypothetical protein
MEVVGKLCNNKSDWKLPTLCRQAMKHMTKQSDVCVSTYMANQVCPSLKQSKKATTVHFIHEFLGENTI